MAASLDDLKGKVQIQRRVYTKMLSRLPVLDCSLYGTFVTFAVGIITPTTKEPVIAYINGVIPR